MLFLAGLVSIVISLQHVPMETQSFSSRIGLVNGFLFVSKNDNFSHKEKSWGKTQTAFHAVKEKLESKNVTYFWGGISKILLLNFFLH